MTKTGINKSLLTAADEGYVERLKALVADGADVDAKDNAGQTALMKAAEKNRVDCVNALIAAGADVNAQTPACCETALMYAASSNGSADCVKALIAAGADVNAKDHVGQTALMNAVEKGNADRVQALIAAGADVNAKDNCGKTPLHRAVCSYRDDDSVRNLVELLLANKAEVNVKAGGQTPLGLAWRSDLKEILRQHGGKTSFREKLSGVLEPVLEPILTAASRIPAFGLKIIKGFWKRLFGGHSASGVSAGTWITGTDGVKAPVTAPSPNVVSPARARSANQADNFDQRERGRVLDESGCLPEALVEAIIVVVGTPDLKIGESDGKFLYKKFNPAWSGKHRVAVLNTERDVKDGAPCVKVCLAHTVLSKGSYLFMQTTEGESSTGRIVICLFTMANWKHPDATGANVVILTSPIPFAQGVA